MPTTVAPDTKFEENSQDIHETMDTTDTPLRELAEDKLCPGADALESINDLHR